MTHTITSCTNCGRTITQCRCPSPYKIKIYGLCDYCKAGKPSNAYKDYPDHPLYGINPDILEAARAEMRKINVFQKLPVGDLEPIADAIVMALREKGFLNE